MPSYSTGLSESFLREYADQPVPWGPVGYCVYKRTYSRLVPDQGRTEEWHETCARACNGLVEIGGLFTHEELENLYYTMFNLKGLVSGRALWQLGTETVNRIGADSLCNCFQGDTKFITSEGVRTFRNAVGETVRVLNHKGKWVEGRVKSFGVQKLWKLTLSHNEEILCTADHQWVPFYNDQIRNDRRWSTRELAGRSLPLVFDELPEVDPEGFAHGVVYGDGSTVTNVNEPYCYVRLFGPKADLLESLSAFGDVTTHNGIPTVIHLPNTWKSVPEGVSRSYALGFILGLISTDGHVRDSVRIHSANREHLTEIRDLAIYAGLKTFPVYCDREKSPFDGSHKPCWCFGINTGNLSPSHFKRDDQRESLHITPAPRSVGVKSVEPTDRVEEVFCLEVPDGHNFVLTNGLVTGNCWIVLCNKLDSFCFCFNQLMLGGGVGVNILPEHVYELPPVKYDPPIKRVDAADCDFIVPDNREGWVELLWRVLKAFFLTGKPLIYSTQCIRAAGKEINSFGGVASGSEPLVKGINQIIKILQKAVGRKLRPIECADIMNIIGTIVVSGNVRRSSEILIGHPHDLKFLNAKNWHKHQVPNWRAMSNMTVAANKFDSLLPDYWEPFHSNGECYGLINLNNCQRFGRLSDGMDYRPDYGVVGCNPCGEANLENREPCNLAEQFLPRINGVKEWTKIAVLLYKAAKTIANFQYSDPETSDVVGRNMRVGIGLSGWMAAQWAHEAGTLNTVYRALEAVDARYSNQLGVPRSVKLTTIKPSGTVSLLPPGITPGMHAAYSRYMIRRIRFAANDPLVETCRRHGYKVEPVMTMDGGYDHGTMVVEFPMDMGPEAITEDRVNVIEQLETQRFIQTWWSDQSISCTHYFKKGEIEPIKAWLKANYEDSVKTCSFMHSVDHGFKQAPLERLTEEQYHELCVQVKPITQITDDQEIDLVDSMECEGGHCPVK